ncbi:G protein pathway suppressor 2-like [Gigantopelta aegis]|uniref:G protein pathway suppressor 2-like n=1 Tax=Gigantopelta aegis TaxID=1735272 RepID=UPI001B88CD88|nr:G protein pathway suppressor 2-like [Gigantopelta aegis]XP_041377919.1 G protein pathway suppressor 2-like [Gigantopelta aegis]
MPALLERPKMSLTMYQALKRHIIKERERKKQEQLQDKLMEERTQKEREMKKKKEEADSLTLEQTKEQIGQLEKRLKELETEKHELFSRLKKVLHQEDESRRRTQIKEQNEMLLQQQGYQCLQMPVSSHPAMLQGISGRPAMYKHAPIITGVKRMRSPSPPSTSSYQNYEDSKYLHSTYTAASKQQPAGHLYQHQQGGEYKGTSYSQSQPGHVTYTSQPCSSTGHTFPQQGGIYTSSQSQAGKYLQPGQSAFTTYPTHYTQHQQKQQLPDNFPPGFAIQRMQQQGYIGSPHSTSISIQQQLEHANQKSGFSDDKYKIQQVREQQRSFPAEPWQSSSAVGAQYAFQRAPLRGKTALPVQQPAIIQQQLQLQQAQSKGSIVTGYTSHPHTGPSSTFQPQSGQGNFPQTTQGRPN